MNNMPRWMQDVYKMYFKGDALKYMYIYWYTPKHTPKRLMVYYDSLRHIDGGAGGVVPKKATLLQKYLNGLQDG